MPEGIFEKSVEIYNDAFEEKQFIGEPFIGQTGHLKQPKGPIVSDLQPWASIVPKRISSIKLSKSEGERITPAPSVGDVGGLNETPPEYGESGV